MFCDEAFVVRIYASMGFCSFSLYIFHPVRSRQSPSWSSPKVPWLLWHRLSVFSFAPLYRYPVIILLLPSASPDSQQVAVQLGHLCLSWSLAIVVRPTVKSLHYAYHVSFVLIADLKFSTKPASYPPTTLCDYYYSCLWCEMKRIH
jgi:hypothetical protein